MISEIKKILFATDLSKNARYAFSYAADIAARYNSSIVILHVIEDMSRNAERQVMDMLGEKEWEELKKKNEKEVMSSLVGKRTERVYA